jgi:hypothetical protein
MMCKASKTSSQNQMCLKTSFGEAQGVMFCRDPSGQIQNREARTSLPGLLSMGVMLFHLPGATGIPLA